MNDTELQTSIPRNTRRYIMLLTLVVCLLIALSFVGFTLRTNQLLESRILEEARILRDSILLVRRWVRGHEGVYVEVDGVPASMSETETLFGRRIFIEDTNGSVYRYHNASQLTKELSAMTGKSDTATFRAVSDSPLNPDDLPDEFESAGLSELRTGATEVSGFVETPDGPEFRYLSPFVTRPICMQCHTDVGWKVGEVNGAISIRLPAGSLLQERRGNILIMLAAGAGVILLVVCTIYYLSSNFTRKLTDANRRLHKMAMEDPLTGLFSRRMGMELLAREIARCERQQQCMAVMMLDIDHFKQVNDRHGHLIGDRCIRALAGVIRRSLRSYDTAFRYGGEEFIIVLSAASAPQVCNIAERLRAGVEKQVVTSESGEDVAFTISIGVASLRSGQDADGLLGDADTALYRAKEAGRNRCAMFDRDAEA